MVLSANFGRLPAKHTPILPLLVRTCLSTNVMPSMIQTQTFDYLDHFEWYERLNSRDRSPCPTQKLKSWSAYIAPPQNVWVPKTGPDDSGRLPY